MIDVTVIGGGPAGMAAALVAGRGKKKVVLFDEELPRNRVTHESHAYLTRDGVTPDEFRQAGRKDLEKYPTIQTEKRRVVSIERIQETGHFMLKTDRNETVETKKVILTTGLKETLPSVPGIHDFYGKSIFSCPFCDGWEMKDQSLVVIVQTEKALHLIKLLKNWSNDLTLATNGKKLFDEEQKAMLKRNGIHLKEETIKELKGTDGKLESVVFNDGEEGTFTGGFCETHLEDATPFVSQLGLNINDRGFVETDQLGRTNVSGVYAAGEITGPSQLIVSASQGHMAGAGVIFEEAEEGFEE
jgi:thioredoxin reductase